MIHVLVFLEWFEWGTLINLKIWSCNSVTGLGLRKYNGLQGEKGYDNAYYFVFLHSSLFSLWESWCDLNGESKSRWGEHLERREDWKSCTEKSRESKNGLAEIEKRGL